ncbi:MAG: hypothetical protein HY726_04700 [Candidatus Rokubacteria bacterium]|nr:hypothetical protein [Candidatus Rokubacteria bacterium]
MWNKSQKVDRGGSKKQRRRPPDERKLRQEEERKKAPIKELEELETQVRVRPIEAGRIKQELKARTGDACYPGRSHKPVRCCESYW